MNTLGIIPNLGAPELLILGIILLLLFGRRLPEVGKSLGQGIVQFKKGLRDIEADVDDAVARPEAARFESAKTPTDASGQDVRVSQTDAVETARPEGGQAPTGQ